MNSHGHVFTSKLEIQLSLGTDLAGERPYESFKEEDMVSLSGCGWS